MNRLTYRIDRLIPGGFHDSLCCLWEGNDLPSFNRSSPYLFDGEAVAVRVMQRLEAKYNKTDPIPGVAPALDITYRVVPVAIRS